MILYFTGTGNSEHVAKKIGEKLGDDAVNVFERLRGKSFQEMHSKRPWVVVAPTYAWRIPRILEEWLEKTKLSGNRSIYFVMTCGGSIGNAGAYLKKLCSQKGMDYLGCAGIVMPENYIALFQTPERGEALKIIGQAEKAVDQAIGVIEKGERFSAPSVTLMDRLNSGVVNDMFYPMAVRAKKFYATDACVSCRLCENVCPLTNIRLEQGRPKWGRDCTHCMACINRCPKEAIEYGKHSVGLPRYTFPK